MIRLFPPSPVVSDAEFSSCGDFRYWLSRPARGAGPLGLIVGLNPSKAGVTDTDHTITKEIEFTSRWGWSGFWKGNLFGRISTDSSALKSIDYDALVGPENDAVLFAMAQRVSEIVVCWGNNVPRLKRFRIGAVMRLLREASPGARFSCFGVTNQGNPVHPLRLAYSTEMQPWGSP